MIEMNENCPWVRESHPKSFFNFGKILIQGGPETSVYFHF